MNQSFIDKIINDLEEMVGAKKSLPGNFQDLEDLKDYNDVESVEDEEVERLRDFFE